MVQKSLWIFASRSKSDKRRGTEPAPSEISRNYPKIKEQFPEISSYFSELSGAVPTLFSSPECGLSALSVLIKCDQSTGRGGASQII